MKKQQIIDELNEYVGKRGGKYPAWYVGVTSDPKERLFTDHGVKEGGGWFHRPCDSSADARAIEEYFLKTRGMDCATYHVYAYEKRDHTDP